MEEKFEIFKENCFNFSNVKKILNEKFDLIFIDPPFKEIKINKIIETIKDKQILSKKGIIIIHRHIKDDIKITEKLKILDERNYGISKIIIGS